MTDSFTEKDRRNREKYMSRPKQETNEKIPLQENKEGFLLYFSLSSVLRKFFSSICCCLIMHSIVILAKIL